MSTAASTQLQKFWSRPSLISWANINRFSKSTKYIHRSVNHTQICVVLLHCSSEQLITQIRNIIFSRYFLISSQVGTNIPQYLEARILNKQPYLLILGDREEPQGVFVIAERKALPQKSLVKAVDVCFKLFYILDLNYPWESATTWEFIQKVVYGLGEPNDNTCKEVIAMRACLNIVNNDD